jgi:hypothetical protein
LGYLTHDGCAANPICSHADNVKGLSGERQISTRERPILRSSRLAVNVLEPGGRE